MVRAWARYLLCALTGIGLGLGAAVYTVRAGALGSTTKIGPWATGSDFGTADASPRTRATVALRGLLALPAREARYYTAATDDAGRPLEGRCSYRVSGGQMAAAWWSLTAYDPDGYLIRNDSGIYSVGSARLRLAEQQRWTVIAGAANGADAARWLPGGEGRFELTLRTYLPANDGRTDLPRSVLPAIVRERCE